MYILCLSYLSGSTMQWGSGEICFYISVKHYFCLSYCYCPIIEDEMLVDFDSLFACSVIFWSTVDTKKFLYYILMYSQLLTKSRSYFDLI